MAICRIKFHRGVEFNFAIEFRQKFSKKDRSKVDKDMESAIIDMNIHYFEEING